MIKEKQRVLAFLGAVAFAAAALSACGGGGRLQATGLRAEYRINPLGTRTSAPRLSWALRSDSRDVVQSAYRILVAETERLLTDDRGNLWDSGRVESNETINIPYAGVPLGSGQRCFWKIRVWDGNRRSSGWSRTASWETALLDPGDWKGAWISDGKPPPEEDAQFFDEDPAPLFRKEFVLDGNPARARLYITGLGYYEARLNGRRVGDQVLDPGWTDYADRILYSTYDVTGLLGKGANCLAVALGNGWYNPLPLRMWGRLNLREHLAVGRPCLLAQLEMRFADGSIQTIVSDRSWQVGEGPLLRNNIYLGEEYDARRETPGWDRAGFDETAWRPATEAPQPGGRLEPQSHPPVRIAGEVMPIAITEPRPGVFIADFGENFAGWVRVRLKASRGTRIRLRYGELLYPDGGLNPMTGVCGQIKRLRPDGTPAGGPGAPEIAVQQDTYICRGGGEETYVPSFTFHAFRYVEISGFPGRPGRRALTGLRLHADLETAGEFRCSDPLFNRIQDMTRRTFLSNLFSVQSDCPHRERFGYGGDLVATCEAFMMNFDMAAFYAKAVRDWQDAAMPDGMLTDTAPYVGIQYCGVAWAMVHPLLQAELYRYYGNRRLIEEQYPVSRRWLDLVDSRYPDHIVTDGLSDHEGLEPAPPGPMVTPLYAESARILGRLARILELEEDEQRFHLLFEAVRATYLENFLEPGTGKVHPDTQAGQALALGLDLLPPDERERALRALIRKIREERDGHLTTGIFGTAHLLEVLSRTGQADLASAVARQKTFPGWGHMLESGATTLWEHWEFSDDIYSHNHPMFGSISAWFFHWLAGIQPHPEANGFGRIRIRPQPVARVTWAEAEYRSLRGPVRVSWRKAGAELVLKIGIPPNTRAEVYMPSSDIEDIREDAEFGKSPPGKRRWSSADGYGICEIGSGNYTFRSKIR